MSAPEALTIDRLLVDVGGDASADTASTTTTGPALLLTGSGIPGGGLRGSSAEVVLTGPRMSLRAPLVADVSGWHATLPLMSSRWGSVPLAPASGRYVLSLVTVHAPTTLSSAVPSDDAVVSANADLPEPILIENVCALAFEVAEDGIVVEISAPLTDDERGLENQARLEAGYRAARGPVIDAVFFESFYGQNASCNPLAIDRELAATRPELERYWSVIDASVAVPPGAIAIVEGSAEWWRVRGSARLIVVNDWLRKRFQRRSGQTVLQTWHGTPLKKIALDRSGLRPRAAAATLLERFRWNILLSQNPYTTRVFRTAYAFLFGAWEEGYPRNDVLVHGDAAALRKRLGIAPESTVILYAPTWRDDRPGDVDQLSVAEFTASLGEGYVTLIRGHSRSMRPGKSVSGGNIIDVTTYPDISELFLASDVLVTDYSSVMFDYTVTGKPLFFFTPDLANYRDELRGFYFDLLAAAPGPVVSAADDLARVIRSAHSDEQHAEFADRYADWRARFNPRDDGNAAKRVVERLIRSGRIH